MIWQYTTLTIPLTIATLVATGLFILSIRHYRSPGLAPFVWLMMGGAIWSLTAWMELASADLPSKLMWSKLQYIGIGTVMTSWLIFVFNYTGHGRWATRRHILLLCIEPVAAFLLAFTNDIHGLIWPTAQLIEIGGLQFIDVTHGLAFWVHVIYSYAVLMFSTYLVLSFLRRSKSLYRGQSQSLLLAVTAPWVSNIVYLTGVLLVDLTPFAFTITGIAIAWGLLRLRLLDMVPIARDLIIENLSDGVLVVDMQNRIVDVNPAAQHILNQNVAPMIGINATQILPELSEWIQQASTGRELRSEFTRAGHDIFEIKLTPLRSQTGVMTGHVVLMHDVTEERQNAEQIKKQNEALALTNSDLVIAREEAEQATRLKSQFLATMSHELRTPLNAIIGYTEIQLAGMSGPLNAEQETGLRRVLANSEHLLKLINEILDLAKVEAGRLELIRKPFDVSEWLKEVVNQTSGLAQSKGLKIEHTFDENMPTTIMGDPARLKQISINLLSNAIKFTEEGHVQISVRRQGEHSWTLSVTDTGIGIPPHLQEVIFDEFRQADNSSKRSYGGTGLGLAIVRKLVLMMGGTVRVNSVVDEGSTFVVTMPLIEPEKQNTDEIINAVAV